MLSASPAALTEGNTATCSPLKVICTTGLAWPIKLFISPLETNLIHSYLRTTERVQPSLKGLPDTKVAQVLQV